VNEGLQPLQPGIFQRLLKALEAEEKRISHSRGFHFIIDVQTGAISTLLALISNL